MQAEALHAYQEWQVEAKSEARDKAALHGG